MAVESRETRLVTYGGTLLHQPGFLLFLVVSVPVPAHICEGAREGQRELFTGPCSPTFLSLSHSSFVSV